MPELSYTCRAHTSLETPPRPFRHGGLVTIATVDAVLQVDFETTPLDPP